MRVLTLTSSYPLHAGDWRGVFVRDLAVALMDQGIECDVAVPRPPDWERGGGPYEDPDGPGAVWLPSVLPGKSRAFHGHGIESNLASHPLSAFSLPPAMVAFGLEASARAIFRDCILAHWVWPMGVVGAAISRASGKPLVIVAHSAPPRLLSPVTTFALRQAALVVCVSETVASGLKSKVGPERLVTLPIGVDLRPAVQPVARRGELSILFVGRLIKLKGVDCLLKAMSRREGMSLTVVGGGPEAPRLRRLAEYLGVKTRFPGELPVPEARATMSGHDLLVIPSRKGWFGREEGLPRVLIEAWASGLPVIASDTGGIGPAIRRHGGGILIRPDDEGDLRQALDSFANDLPLRARLRDQALAAAGEFSWQRLGPRWAAMLAGLKRG